MPKFYTGQGDTGETSLFGCPQKVSKTNPKIEALGAVDELNSYLGVCKSLAADENVKKALLGAQENLFIIQAELAGAEKRLDEAKLKSLEKTIDELGEFVGPITKFTIAGGEPLSAHLDYARAVCRKAERFTAELQEEAKPPLGGLAPKWLALAYLNRLSSLLFVLARYTNKKAGVSEDHPAY
ncbi:ATP:cob(I)alamin adenosyltransferase [Candidatus Giovannonibacteria bacterium RIFCSPLOWO2_12_FULL_44_25]|uniref:Corrinoid adenosyltransferase n=2 Tax=Candidatus Giovannoniibacteriota TaxID=1752738 RepID=A0A1F5W8Z6_9BACT|nr:MAG: ATP/cobalamin adenosyltransferase [Parcubacteria group bacterium GW2011_GWC1_44_10]KKT59201.1 MAG: ATP/cobalamin adenosyltransferase [Candidatus Giovannonibacteria bacterium GW2011_GWA1_44_25]KKU29925.1 MAG: ATP/cobalamin adenosyltransferase [Candidatus Giovannonibacteria bacterium GW2011_GWB1_46_20]OGF50561.1 MAG: ATP:cob(I)alamin adenosyltransferase [Candidatus Giovannonibacteria bacterium GWA2_45_15]OGF60311.1 MAG: ATP:cob(I)alamin adenosyltransferase [Candidatus Giovannonibacteria b